MIDAEPWQRFLAQHPVLFHVTTEANVESILSGGLMPGSERGVSTLTNFFATRPGHVYLIKQADVEIVEVAGEPRLLAVDLAQLDPRLVDPDEDIVKENLADMVEIPPPRREMDAVNCEVAGQEGRLAQWASSTPGFDRSEVAERSLFEHGRCAYRGTVPRSAITFVERTSEPLVRFVQCLEPALQALLVVPPQSSWKVEVARVTRLAGALCRGMGAALGLTDVEVDVTSPYGIDPARQALMAAAREAYASGRVEVGGFIYSLCERVETVGHLSGLSAKADMPEATRIALAFGEAFSQFAALAEVTDELKTQVLARALEHAVEETAEPR